MIKPIYRPIPIASTILLSLLHTSASVTTAQAGIPDVILDYPPVQIAQNDQSDDFTDQGRPEQRVGGSSRAQNVQNDDPFDFGSEGRPGSRTGGGSRSDCPSPDPPLTALVPSTNLGTTISSHPTLWFYVPYTATQAPVGEFVLQTVQRDDIMRRSFTLPQGPGLVRVTVPESEAALFVDQEYRWYFNLYCGPDQDGSPVYAQGWIKRVSLDDEGWNDAFDLRLDQDYAREGIWFDALNELANLRRDRPSDPALLNDWQRLLNHPGIMLELPGPEFAGAVEFQVPE